MKGKNRQNYFYYILLVLLAIAAFWIVYSFGPLNVTADEWMLVDYDEWDILQHYTGWMNFRDAAWSFPLGKSLNMAVPEGCIISFHDSKPWVAIVFKCLRNFLPEVFQYEGIFMLTTFILQGISAFLVLHELVEDKKYCVLGSIFFLFSPIMLERGFRHSSLSFHCLILFSLFIYIRYHKKLLEAQAVKWMIPLICTNIISAVSVGITPYLLPMTMIFVLLTVIDIFLYGKEGGEDKLRAAGYFISNIISALVCSYILGAVGSGISSSRDGYGFFSMNLNAIFNPYSIGKYTWSKILPVLEQNRGQYDGFNYLGFGIITLSGIVILHAIVKFIRSEDKKQVLRQWCKNYLIIFVVCIFLMLFAVSNNIYWGKTNIFSVDLPEVLISLCGIFRASSRMFYPVYYIIFIYSIVGLYKLCNSDKMSRMLVIVFLFIQIYDLSGVITEKHTQMEKRFDVSYDGPIELLNLQDEYDFMLVDRVTGQRYNLFLTGRNNLRTNGCDANTGWYVEAWHLFEDEDVLLNQGKLKRNYIYTTYDKEKYLRWQEQFEEKADFYTWTNILGKQGYSRYWEGDIYYMLPKIDENGIVE